MQIIAPRWLIPIEPHATVLIDHAVITDHERIVQIMPLSAARTAYPSAKETLLAEHALLPGLINTHTHSAMSLLRGYADDLALMTWLHQHIWPTETAHVSDDFVFDGTTLAIMEMIAGGTTCANDMYFEHSAVACAAISSGFRMGIGCSILEFPTPFASDADGYIKKALSSRAEFNGEPLVHFTLAPHAPYTVSDSTFRRVITLADELDLGLHCHIHETQDEIKNSLKQYGVRPLERLAALGFLGSNLVAAHMVHTSDTEIALLAKHGVNIAHNPASNLKLASGIARIHAMQQAGINVSIGTDGAASNNKIDLFAEMRLAALLAKAQANNAEAIPAWQALEMATINAAKAMRLDDKIGSIKVGKQADLIAVDLSAAATQPCYDPISQLVYAADRSQVSHAWIAGRCVYQAGQHLSLNAGETLNRARRWQQRIKKEA
ncbi:TRZ/ATZ family hydrolase [Janthinobacterium sp. B9-8]|uniref:TRZ/ATZ family hydrolase n=1 Tax=Janthinobacterium sp. B9-8 TaxID=1236179 RepID=UPI00061D381B|nr:TRZ/ATZ family hydrolase [Janthinobacterium sp. B9-8]AMC35299.1 N-ethylammeline chlorohydrolase [Janthinobacterium sp. B9-8]